MAEKDENNKGCTTMIVLVSILVIGLIFRFIYDTENLLKNMRGWFLGIVIIFIVVWVSNNYKRY